VYSEGELEEVLTVYTRLNHSASVFLRSNSRPVSAAVPSASSKPCSATSSSGVSPVKGQDASPSGKQPRVKESVDSRVNHSSVDQVEGAVFLSITSTITAELTERFLWKSLAIRQGFHCHGKSGRSGIVELVKKSERILLLIGKTGVYPPSCVSVVL